MLVTPMSIRLHQPPWEEEEAHALEGKENEESGYEVSLLQRQKYSPGLSRASVPSWYAFRYTILANNAMLTHTSRFKAVRVGFVPICTDSFHLRPI